MNPQCSVNSESSPLCHLLRELGEDVEDLLAGIVEEEEDGGEEEGN
jgi:hypothetical protein